MQVALKGTMCCLCCFLMYNVSLHFLLILQFRTCTHTTGIASCKAPRLLGILKALATSSLQNVVTQRTQLMICFCAVGVVRLAVHQTGVNPLKLKKKKPRLSTDRLHLSGELPREASIFPVGSFLSQTYDANDISTYLYFFLSSPLMLLLLCRLVPFSVLNLLCDRSGYI
jgi:hypothetical protein